MSEQNTELLARLNELILQSYRVEREFRDYKALYEGVIGIIPQAIWVINDDNTIFYRNKLALNLNSILQKIGIDAKEPSQDSAEFSMNLIDEPQNEQKQEFQREIDLGGKTFLVQLESLNKRKIITATDITVQKRSERLAAMGQISAHLAHEIRNPIGSISLLCSTLLKKAPKEIHHIIYEVQKSIFRIERQIKSTLLFSRGVALNLAKHEIKSLQIDELIAQYSYSKDIDFDMQLCDGSASFDIDLLEIVLQNFIYNSIDAIEESDNESGKICLRAEIKEDELIFYISDNGKEIENKDALFEPFVSTKLKGNGLGLVLSQQIIQAHNGRISLLDSPQNSHSQNSENEKLGFTKTFEISIRS
ncbi:MAG: ATP-binding protein [Helicobacter sp.]|nr:ATP-binding protein [Helicobacter sp.]